MVVHVCCAPIWRPENSVNIWNLLWLSKRLILYFNSKKAKNYEIGSFSTNAIVALSALCHAPP